MLARDGLFTANQLLFILRDQSHEKGQHLEANSKLNALIVKRKWLINSLSMNYKVNLMFGK